MRAAQLAMPLANALVLDGHGEILWAASVEAGAEWIEVAGDLSADEAPLNVRAYRVSASVADRQRALLLEEPVPLCRREYQGRVFYTESTE